MTTLIGTNPDQIPVNSMLGGMAYQDPDSINVKDFNSSGTANIASLVSPTASITNLSYSGTLTGGTGVINIGSNQIYKDASGNIGLGAVPISNGKTLALVNTTTNPSSFYLQNSTTGFTTTDGTLLQLSGSASYLWNFENSTLSLGTNNTEFVRLTSTGDLLNLGTGATKLHEGTTAQRPASPQEGMIRKNSTTNEIEGYSGGAYQSLEAGRLIARTRFTTSGTFTTNVKTKMLIVDLVSGGGGSGGVTATGAGQVAVSSPGDSGWFVKALLPRGTTIAASYTITIGAAGAAGVSSGGSGGAGGTTIITDGTNRVLVTGGGGGSGGTATSSFPVIKSNPYNYTMPDVLGAFIIWESKFPAGTQLVVHDSVSKISSFYPGNPFSSTAGLYTIGVGGTPFTAFASSSAQPGNAGNSGEVIIYEYS